MIVHSCLHVVFQAMVMLKSTSSTSSSNGKQVVINNNAGRSSNSSFSTDDDDVPSKNPSKNFSFATKITKMMMMMATRNHRRLGLSVLAALALFLMAFCLGRESANSSSLTGSLASSLSALSTNNHKLSEAQVARLTGTSRKTVVESASGRTFEYDRDSPLIFIGGVPRSGTTLMRAMLDAHPDVRCGEETRVVPRLLQMRSQWMKSSKESMRLEEAGLSHEVLASAISSFILEVIARHAEPAPRLCNKDPFTLKSGVYLKGLFPRSKFLFMVRDGRATVHSIITRKVSITGFDLASYRQCLTKWNTAISTMKDQCDALGDDHCLKVPYEQLVLHPGEWMKKILAFLDLPWTDEVLHHERQINKPNGVSLSNVERSSDQVYNDNGDLGACLEQPA